MKFNSDNGFKGIFDSFSTVNDNDYINEADGLLYCGKCHTPKEKITEHIGKHFIRCQCELQAIKDQEKGYFLTTQEEMKQERKERCFKSDYAVFKDYTFDNADNKDTKVFKLCKRYADRFDDMIANKLEKNGLVLSGGYGTGKTYMSICIANAVIDSGYGCLLTDFSRIWNEWFPLQDKQEYIERFKTIPLLIIDDFGVQRDTPGMLDLIYSIINERYKVRKPLIITTNLSLAELQNPKEEIRRRYYDRICEICYLFDVKGINRRKDRQLSSNPEMKKFYEE